MTTTKNKYDTPEEFRERCLEMADNIDRNYRASVRAMVLLTGTVGEGLNPRIYCAESIPKKDVDFTSAF